MKVVIVGGVAGGATAAARIRRLNEAAEIVIFEQSGFISYANCGLPYYIGGVIPHRSQLTLQTPQQFFNRYAVDVKVHHRVEAINPEEKTVTVTNLLTQESFQESYDKLLLSPGSQPIQPPLKGIDDERIFTLRNVEDTFAIDDFIGKNNPKKAVVVGGGFIGLEMAENLRHKGLEVTLVELQSQVFMPFDKDMAAWVHGVLRENGVNLILGRSVEGFSPTKEELLVQLKDTTLSADLVIMAVGVQPDTRLAKSANLHLGLKNAIMVNDKMQTSNPDIYAVGDAVEINHLLTHQKTLLPLAGPANKQARIAADNICGGSTRYKGAQGTSILKLFGMSFAATGLNEAAAQKEGISYDKTVTLSASHATYYPGAGNLTVKVLFATQPSSLFKKGQIIGAQIFGNDGVDKRLDVLACAIRGQLTAEDLTDLELAYAPPFSSAKDPVNVAGYVISNILDESVKQFHWNEVEKLLSDEKNFFVDVRTPAEFQAAHIPGALNIPVDNLREHLSELPKDKTLCLICQSALRSYIAAKILSGYGFKAQHLSGGFRFFQRAIEEKVRLEKELLGECGLPLKGNS